MSTLTLNVGIPAFVPFYRSVLPRERVHDLLTERTQGLTDPAYAEEILDMAWEWLITTVEEHSFRTLIGSFHTFRRAHGLPKSEESSHALELFSEYLCDEDAVATILDTHPVLRDRLATLVPNSLDAYAEVFDAYRADLPVLREHGLVGGGHLIRRVFATGSDPHNDNRQVFGVRLEDDTRIVYKPRALTGDDFVRDLYHAAAPYLQHSLEDCVPRSITVSDHGWQRFVETIPMDSPDQPARYYYRFGALCALFGSIGAADLHNENVLARGEAPCVLDSETMLKPNPDIGVATLPNTLGNQLKLSVASTMLVPSRNPASKLDILMAGVGVEGDQVSELRRPNITGRDSDAVQVGWTNVTYTHENNLPKLGERVLRSTDHYKHILDGYLDALAAVRDDALNDALERHTDLPVRVLIRSTMVYARFLDAATHPSYLLRQEEAERMLNLLGHYPNFLPQEGADYVRREEYESLNTGNIPYFMSRGGSTELATSRSSFPGAYATSPLDYAREGIRLNAERSDLYHRFVMEECFSEVVGEDSPAGLWEHSVFRQESAGLAPGTWWPGIADRISRIGVTFQGEQGSETGWLCGAGPDGNAFTVNPGNLVSFHDAGGAVTFFGRAARLDDRWDASYQAADRGLDSLLGTFGATLDEAPEAVFTSVSSLLLIRPDHWDESWLTGLVDRIEERVTAGTAATDLVGGPAGLLMALLAKPEDTVPVAVLTRLRDLVLPHIGLKRDRAWYDVAHGELGMRWAAARIGRALGDRHLVEESADWLRDRVDNGPFSEVNGWCNGTAGLILAAAEITGAADRREWLEKDHLSSWVDRATSLRAGPVDLSVCHGTSGVTQALLATAHFLDAPELADRAREYQATVIDRVRNEGFYTGAPGRTSLLGYMLGWAGIGDTDLLLRTGAPQIPVAFTL